MRPSIRRFALLLAILPPLAGGCGIVDDNPDCGAQHSLPFGLNATSDFTSSGLPRESEMLAGGIRSFRWTTAVIDGVCTKEHVSATFIVTVNAAELRPAGTFTLTGQIYHYFQQPYEETLVFNGGPRQWQGTVTGGLDDINWTAAQISPQYYVRLDIRMVSHGSEATDWAILKPYLDEISVSTTYRDEKTSTASLLGR